VCGGASSCLSTAQSSSTCSLSHGQEGRVLLDGQYGVVHETVLQLVECGWRICGLLAAVGYFRGAVGGPQGSPESRQGIGRCHTQWMRLGSLAAIFCCVLERQVVYTRPIAIFGHCWVDLKRRAMRYTVLCWVQCAEVVEGMLM
jgi:hypothetical protein